MVMKWPRGGRRGRESGAQGQPNALACCSDRCSTASPSDTAFRANHPSGHLPASSRAMASAVSTGVHQGCPLAPSLLILVALALQELVASNPDLKGLPVPGPCKPPLRAFRTDEHLAQESLQQVCRRCSVRAGHGAIHAQRIPRLGDLSPGNWSHQLSPPQPRQDGRASFPLGSGEEPTSTPPAPPRSPGPGPRLACL